MNFGGLDMKVPTLVHLTVAIWEHLSFFIAVFLARDASH
jgi:hypothetical protein